MTFKFIVYVLLLLPAYANMPHVFLFLCAMHCAVLVVSTRSHLHFWKAKITTS